MNRAMLEDRRVIVGGGVLLTLVLVALTWFLLAGPQFAAADDYATQQADAETQNATLAAKNTALSREDPQALADELVAAQAGLPTSTAFPAFTREVTSVAKATGVSLVDIAIAEPGPVTDPTAAAADPAAQPSGPQAVVVTITSDGSLSEQSAFLKRLQDGARRTLVTSSQVNSNGNEGKRINSVDGATTMTSQLTIFVAPAAA